MTRRYHREEKRQSAAAFVSFLTFQAIALLTASAFHSNGGALKDCLGMPPGSPATVRQGR